MGKSIRQRKLDLLKALAAKDKLAKSLEQEKSLNILQTKMMENELNKMKEQLQGLEHQRSQLMIRAEEVEQELMGEEADTESIPTKHSDDNTEKDS